MVGLWHLCLIGFIVGFPSFVHSVNENLASHLPNAEALSLDRSIKNQQRLTKKPTTKKPDINA